MPIGGSSVMTHRIFSCRRLLIGSGPQSTREELRGRGVEQGRAGVGQQNRSFHTTEIQFS